MNRAKMFAGVFLVTMSVLMLQLGLTRLFSATMYYHFAFLVISLALLGSGASGVFVYIFQRRLSPDRTGLWLSRSALLFAFATLFALYVVLSHPLTLESGPENYYRLAKIYGATTLPFFFAGCVVTLAITRLAEDISRLYVFDLAGAAVGCLLLIPVLDRIGAINTIFFIAAVAGCAAALFSFAEGSSRTQVAASLASCAALAALLVHGVSTNWVDIQVSKGVEERRLLFAKWNSFSRITVEGDLERSGSVEIKIDSDAATSVAYRADDLSLHQQQRQYIPALAYNLKPDANVLIIGPGGGQDVVTALVYGSRSITAVEVNPIIARDVMSSEPFKSYSGDVYGQPGVNLVVDEGRSFIRRSRDRYDLVQLTVVDTWAATSAGAFALTENNLYTVEAFEDYATHLTDDGVLTITRWYFEPPDQLLRLLSLTRAMMDELGIENPPRHVMLIRDARRGFAISPATYLFKRSEFTDDEVRLIEDIAREAGFEILYTPLTRPDNVFTRMMEADDPAEVWSSFETNVAPTRDNNPFFFNSIRWSNLPRALEGVGEWQKTNLGTFVLFVVLVITTVLVILFILGPLALVRRRDLATGGRNKIPYLLYFGCLGAGFIIVEVAMIQKFILFLGHPVYALAVVLFSLLLFSAAGSWLTGRFDPDRLPSTIAKLLVAVVAVVGIYIVALSPIFYGLVHLPLAARIAIAVVLLAPLGVVMGMPMPSGIRMMARRAPELIPWAWGVNGATSVMGSVVALVIAMLAGFNEALLVGSALYLLAIFLITRPQDAVRA
jgi:predicted membrane-bound spermidine synthase